MIYLCICPGILAPLEWSNFDQLPFLQSLLFILLLTLLHFSVGLTRITTVHCGHNSSGISVKHLLLTEALLVQSSKLLMKRKWTMAICCLLMVDGLIYLWPIHFRMLFLFPFQRYTQFSFRVKYLFIFSSITEGFHFFFFFLDEDFSLTSNSVFNFVIFFCFFF